MTALIFRYRIRERHRRDAPGILPWGDHQSAEEGASGASGIYIIDKRFNFESDPNIWKLGNESSKDPTSSCVSSKAPQIDIVYFWQINLLLNSYPELL